MHLTEFFWDFDGTLFDTYGRITRAFMKGLADWGIQTDFGTALKRLKGTLGDAAGAYAKEKGDPSVTMETLLAAYHLHAEEEDESTMRPFPGTGDALRAVTRSGGRNYLYTHRGRGALEALKRENLLVLFTDSVTGEDGFPLKPAPDALMHLIGKHGLRKDSCVMIGDRDIDLDAGKNAGIHCILFDPDGFYPDYQADERFDTMAELARFCGKGYEG